MRKLTDEIMAEFVSQYGDNFSSIDEVNSKMQQFMMQRNNVGRNEFEGYSPVEMNDILYHTFSIGNIVQLRECSSDVYSECPLFRQIKYVISVLQRDGKIKLTTKGALPTKLVKELYPLGASDYLVETGLAKLYKETNTIATQLTHLVMKQMKIIKEVHGVMTIVKGRAKMVEDDHALMKSMFYVMTNLLNFAYFDWMEENLGVVGISYSIVLLHKYGDKKRAATFYSTKYFKALFPGMEDHHVYWIRVFDRCLRQLGLITYEESSWCDSPYVKKTDLFDKLITVAAPKGK
jgi:hypothetical protein